MVMVLWLIAFILVVGFTLVLTIPLLKERRNIMREKENVLDSTLNFVNYIYDEALEKKTYTLKHLKSYEHFTVYKTTMSIVRNDSDFTSSFLDEVDEALKKFNGKPDSVFAAYEDIKNIYVVYLSKIGVADLDDDKD